MLSYKSRFANVVYSAWTWIVLLRLVGAADLRAEENPCQGKPNGSYQRHPLGCKYFIMCMNNNVNSGACPPGLAFNPAKPPCDLARNVGCLDELETTTRPPTTTTTSTTIRPTTTTTTTTTTPIPTTTTTSTTTHPSTTTSTTTSSTTSTTTATPAPATKQPPETTSTTSTTTTDAPKTTTTTSTIPFTTSTTTTTRPPSFTVVPTTSPPFRPPINVVEPLINCPIDEDMRSVRFLSSNEDCAKYYLCYHNQPITMMCSDGLHWNHRTHKCDLQERAGCNISPTPNYFPICPRESVGLYAHPFKCELFLYCYHGHMTVQQCPFYYHWDVDLQSCEMKDVAKCGAHMADYADGLFDEREAGRKDSFGYFK